MSAFYFLDSTFGVPVFLNFGFGILVLDFSSCMFFIIYALELFSTKSRSVKALDSELTLFLILLKIVTLNSAVTEK